MGLFKKKPTEFDTSQDEQIKTIWQWITQLNKNQQILIPNNNNFIKQIAQLRKENQAQDVYDAQVRESLKTLDSKIVNVLELSNTVKELQKQIAQLQAKETATS